MTLSWCTGRFDPPTLVVGGGTHPTEAVLAATAAAAASAPASAPSSTGTVNAVVIYRYMDTARAWLPLRVLPRFAGAGGSSSSSSSSSSSNPAQQLQQPLLAASPALCVAWAPNVGRRYHYVAAAYGDALVVYKLRRGASSAAALGAGAAASTTGAAPPSASTSAAAAAASTTDDLKLESVQVLPVSSAWRCQWNVTGTVLACSGDSGRVLMYKVSPHSGLFDLVSSILHSGG
jgi:nucleoporin SEH1